MKIFLSLLILTALTIPSFAQNASNYFPSIPGYKWLLKNTPLDSVNNPVQSGSTYQVDSFANVTTYQGLTSSRVLSKTGLLTTNQNTPYTDTNYYNFQSTNAWYYLNVLSYIGSIPLIDSIAFVNFLRSFEQWYSFYRFGQPVNSNYTIFSKDTTMTIDTLKLPFRVSTVGRRLNDQTISTVNGNYLSKKFLITFTVSYGLLPPLIYIPIITQPDTIYIAENVWRVKEVRPTVNVDLTSIGFPITFSIPGMLTELTLPVTGINQQSGSIPESFELHQNYPNPFNPSTKIEFDVPVNDYVILRIFNSEGREIAQLVNEMLQAGSYSVKFNAENLPSGVYYCKLESGVFSIVKKMMLLK